MRERISRLAMLRISPKYSCADTSLRALPQRRVLTNDRGFARCHQWCADWRSGQPAETTQAATLLHADVKFRLQVLRIHGLAVKQLVIRFVRTREAQLSFVF
jgi:hypothetical protein